MQGRYFTYILRCIDYSVLPTKLLTCRFVYETSTALTENKELFWDTHRPREVEGEHDGIAESFHV